jgi:hypothetical protein
MTLQKDNPTIDDSQLLSPDNFRIVKWSSDEKFVDDEAIHLLSHSVFNALKEYETIKKEIFDESPFHPTLWEVTSESKDTREITQLISGLGSIATVPGCTLHSFVKTHETSIDGYHHFEVYVTAPNIEDAYTYFAYLTGYRRGSSDCSHEHDCCGCWSSSPTTANYMGEGRYRITKSSTRNV